MKKSWAILCVIGFAAFWSYALAILAALGTERVFQPLELVACLFGLSVGVFARLQIHHVTPAMQRQLAAARVRLEEEYVYGDRV